MSGYGAHLIACPVGWSGVAGNGRGGAASAGVVPTNLFPSRSVGSSSRPRVVWSVPLRGDPLARPRGGGVVACPVMWSDDFVLAPHSCCSLRHLPPNVGRKPGQAEVWIGGGGV